MFSILSAVATAELRSSQQFNASSMTSFLFYQLAYYL
jgi:hypothetical protein